MIKRDPQEIADFFGGYVAQECITGDFRIFSEKPVLLSDDEFHVENVWCTPGKPNCKEIFIDKAFINIPENHNFCMCYEPQGKSEENHNNTAPHQSEVHTHREYVLLGEFSPSELCVKVSEYLEKGFKLYGYPWTGPDCGRCGYIHYQAMVRGLE